MQSFSIVPITGGICAPLGFVANGINAGFKANNALDLAYIYAKDGFKVNAVFTNNLFKAAPIIHFKKNVAPKHARGEKSNFILINTKNANAMTGRKGYEDVCEILEKLKAKFPSIENPISASTGVIGVYLDKEKFYQAFEKISLKVNDAESHLRASDAIRTTDRFSKEIALEVKLASGKSFRIGAMCKGAGMIAPSLATMLCFVSSDVIIPSDRAQEILENAARKNFDCISVDGDMSTNDSVFLLSNGKSGAFDEDAFIYALDIVLHKLALDIVRDGEGSSKIVAFEITGARNDEEAKIAAKALSNSLLVKTALFGCDPNWGRIASTIGASRIQASEEALVIKIGGIKVFDRGKILFNAEIEAKTAQVMREEELRVVCELGQGSGRYIAYGCDLGYEYVKINSDYRS